MLLAVMKLLNALVRPFVVLDHAVALSDYDLYRALFKEYPYTSQRRQYLKGCYYEKIQFQ